MALSGIIKQSLDAGSIVLEDGTTPTALAATVRFDGGDFSVSGLRRGQRASTVYQGRGRVRSIRKGAREFPTITFSWDVTDFTETSTGTVLDFIYRTSGTPYASAVSTNTSISDVDLCDITFTQEGTDYGDSADGTVTFTDCEITEAAFAEGEPNKFNLTATVYGAITGDIADDPNNHS